MQISVDGDTSTNDTVLGLASGMAGGREISDASSTEGQQLEAAVTALLQANSCFCHPFARPASHPPRIRSAVLQLVVRVTAVESLDVGMPLIIIICHSSALCGFELWFFKK